MLKGAQKRMVMLRTADSSLFETAYFILRDDGNASADTKQPTMLEEANRILDQSFTPRTAAKGKNGGAAAADTRSAAGVFDWFFAGRSSCGIGMDGYGVGGRECEQSFLSFIPCVHFFDARQMK
jgi:hypothetical protein